MPLALECVLGKSQPKVVEYKHKEQRQRVFISPAVPLDLLVVREIEAWQWCWPMLLAATISHINKFTSCFMHFWSCYCMFGLFGISAWGVPGYPSTHNPGAGVAAGFVLGGGPGVPSCTSCSHPSWQGSSWGAAAEGKWWHTIWHWLKTEWETCRCVVGVTASYPTMIIPQRWSWHSAAFWSLLGGWWFNLYFIVCNSKISFLLPSAFCFLFCFLFFPHKIRVWWHKHTFRDINYLKCQS